MSLWPLKITYPDISAANSACMRPGKPAERLVTELSPSLLMYSRTS